MILINCLADYNSSGITCPREVNNLAGRTLRIDRNAGSSCFQSAEVSHAPFGCIVTHQHQAIAMLDALTGKESCCSQRELTHISVGVLLLASIALDAHRHTRRVSLGRSLEQLQQIAIRVDSLWLRPHLVFERGEYPFRQPWQMDIKPVVV